MANQWTARGATRRGRPRSRHDAFARHVLARPKAAAIELRHVLPAAVLAQIELEARIYVDDLRGSVLDDPVADPGHLALVEVARTLLYTYENPHALDDPRLGTLCSTWCWTVSVQVKSKRS